MSIHPWHKNIHHDGMELLAFTSHFPVLFNSFCSILGNFKLGSLQQPIKGCHQRLDTETAVVDEQDSDLFVKS